jgi:undecaprenyl pyrophosphate phosphatase UppP
VELWRMATLAVMQGITEFLPISTSADLILFLKRK